MKVNLISAITLFVIIMSFPSCNQEPEIYEWRGLDRAGIYFEEGLMKEWPEDGLQVVWEYEGVGNGFGSPVFTDDRMYITGELDDLDSMAFLFCFEIDGELLWKADFGKEWVKNWNGSRSAPTIVDDLIYVISGMGNLYCFDNTGEKIWSISMVDDFGGVYPLFGYSEAVVVEGDKVFCTPGGPEHNVIALDRFTGELIWSCKGAGERPGYNQPKLIKLEERSVLVTFTAYEMLGIDTETGELLWKHDQDNTPLEEREPGKGDTHANTILYENGYIYYAEGDGNAGVKLKLSEEGSAIEEVWRNPEFDSYMGGIIKLGNYIYGCGSVKPGLLNINAETGEIGSRVKAASGAVIASEGLLYYYDWRGDLMLVDPEPLNMQVISKFKIDWGTAQHFSHPVINDGKLYLRHGNVIKAFDISIQ
jgi:outer membrane protein assembly factor BamB